MTDRDNPGGGGLTGATGDLTADVPDSPFEPGERREVEGPDRARVTHAQAAGAPDDDLPANDSAHGMEETHPPAAGDAATETPRAGETRIGGDELADSEERF